MGLSPLHKCTSVIRMLAYEFPADFIDKYVRIGKSIAIECLERFTRDVNRVFGVEYLRKSSNTDVEHSDITFQVCWVPLIVCTGNEKIVQLHENDNFVEVISDITRLIDLIYVFFIS